MNLIKSLFVSFIVVAGYAQIFAADNDMMKEKVKTMDEPECMFIMYDTNKDGEVVLEEFLIGRAADFKKLDTDKDGKLTPKEIEKQSVLYPVKTKDGKISEEDFVAAFVMSDKKPDQKIIDQAKKNHKNTAEKSSFKKMDLDNNGKITPEEMTAFYIAIHQNHQLTDEDGRKESITEKWFKKIDHNKDGFIVIEEYSGPEATNSK